MASLGQSESPQASAPKDVLRPALRETDTTAASTPIEMSSYPTTNNMESSQSEEQGASTQGLRVGQTSSEPSRTDQGSPQGDPQSPSSSAPAVGAPTDLAGLQSTAIGPSSDALSPVTKQVESKGPTLAITLLLVNGARHPFKLDAKYMKKRNVEVLDNDPFNLSVYKLKELILREWREEWETKPSSPSSIRLISFGKLLDGKAALKDSKFDQDSPNVVHMSIKPQDMLDEEEAAAAKTGKKGGSRGDGEEGRSHGCRCVIL